jgi:hypothetical protein
MRELMKKNRVVFLSLGIFFLTTASVFADVDKIFLKSGTSYEGKLVGKSDKRYLFKVNSEGEVFEMSFFPEEVEKLELGKDSMDREVPYLKEVEPLKVPVKAGKPTVYELSLYQESVGKTDTPSFTEQELKSKLSKEEVEYYDKFNDILKRYTDKLFFVQNVYVNLTTATRDDFELAKGYMDSLYFELNNIVVPETFKKSHGYYLQSVKANYLTFSALKQGMLDEAAQQMKITDENKQASMAEFRQVIALKKSSSSSVGAANKLGNLNETGNSR